MADGVILVGARRGMERVPVNELMQMIGRAGRNHDGGECHADVILDSKDFSIVASEMDKGGKLDVKSAITDCRSVAFHLLPQISDGGVETVQEASSWLSKTLAAFQGSDMDLESALGLLEGAGAVRVKGDELKATRLGSVAASLYFHAEDVKAWLDNFTELFDQGLEDEELGAAWALGNVPVERAIGDFSDKWEVVNECKASVPQGLFVREGSLINVLMWWCVMGGVSAGKMRHKVLSMRDDFGRIRKALEELDNGVARWGKGDYFEKMALRVSRGIPMKIFDICAWGVSKSLAYHLYNMGVRDEISLRDNLEMISDDIDERNMKILRGIIESI